jgi:hypothetical protein
MDTPLNVIISLTHDRALVLFEWLYRESKGNRIPSDHESELRVLWHIEGQLERLLVAPLNANYHEAIKVARERVVIAKEGS